MPRDGPGELGGQVPDQRAVEPVRRTDADALASAWILFHVGAHTEFREAIRFNDAIAWFEANAHLIDSDARRLWDRAKSRCVQLAPVRINRAPEVAVTAN